MPQHHTTYFERREGIEWGKRISSHDWTSCATLFGRVHFITGDDAFERRTR